MAQQAAGKIPGYSGYVPAKDAENVYGGTFAQVGEMSAAESVFRANQRGERHALNETLKQTKRAEEARLSWWHHNAFLVALAPQCTSTVNLLSQSMMTQTVQLTIIIAQLYRTRT